MSKPDSIIPTPASVMKNRTNSGLNALQEYLVKRITNDYIKGKTLAISLGEITDGVGESFTKKRILQLAPKFKKRGWRLFALTKSEDVNPNFIFIYIAAIKDKK